PGAFAAPPAPGAAPPPGPGPSAPPPQRPYPPGPQPSLGGQPASPYYAPPGGMPPSVSRTSPGLVIGIAVLALAAIVVVCLGGFLVVRAISGGGGQAQVPPPAVTSPGPTTAPTAGPTTPPTGNSGGAGSTVSTNTLSVTPGSQFQVARQTGTEVDLQGSAGDIAVAAGKPDNATTTAGELAAIRSNLQSQYGDVESCVTSQGFAIGGKSGTLEGFRYTDTDPSGTQVQVCDAYWVDAAANGKLYEYEQIGPSATWNSDLEPAAQPVRTSIRWLV
ncbi:MAG: hypothetical protein ACREQM_23515, partial [Candidatus Dormibacteraceae bacterium]